MTTDETMHVELSLSHRAREKLRGLEREGWRVMVTTYDPETRRFKVTLVARRWPAKTRRTEG